MADRAASARSCAEQAASALEAAGDLTAARRLHYLLAAAGTSPAELLQAAGGFLDARLAAIPAAAVAPPMSAADALRSQASRALQGVSTRLAREFEARLAEIRLHAEQQLMVGVGPAEAALASFHADIARLAHDLETRLWAEIGGLAAAIAHEVDLYGIARLAADLPAPLRRIPVTLSVMESTGPALTAGDALTGLSQAAQLIKGIKAVPGLAADPTGLLLPTAMVATLVSAQRRAEAAARTNRNLALRQVSEACAAARSALLDPVFRAAAQAQFFLLERALDELSSTRSPHTVAITPAPDALTQARARITAAQHSL